MGRSGTSRGADTCDRASQAEVTASAKAQGWEVLVCLRSGKPASQGEALSYRLEEVGQTGLHPAGL